MSFLAHSSFASRMLRAFGFRYFSTENITNQSSWFFPCLLSMTDKDPYLHHTKPEICQRKFITEPNYCFIPQTNFCNKSSQTQSFAKVTSGERRDKISFYFRPLNKETSAKFKQNLTQTLFRFRPFLSVKEREKKKKKNEKNKKKKNSGSFAVLKNVSAEEFYFC